MRLAAPASLPLATAVSAPHAAGAGNAEGIERGNEGEGVGRRDDGPPDEVEQGAGDGDGTPPQRLQDGEGLGALGVGEAGDAGEVAPALRHLQPLQRRAGPGLGLDATGVAQHAGEAGGAVAAHQGLEGRAVHRRRAGGEAAQGGEVDAFPHRAGKAAGQRCGQPPGVPGHLHQRNADAHRQARPQGGVGAGRDGEAHGGEAEDELVHILAAGEFQPLAAGVADVAPHHEVACRRPRETREVLRLAGDEAEAELLRRAQGLRRRAVGGGDLRPQIGGHGKAACVSERQEGSGQRRVVVGERRLDAAAGIFRREAGKAEVGQRGGIIPRPDELDALLGQRQQEGRAGEEGHEEREQCEDAGHGDCRKT
ncbi:hypothetical protein EZH22_17375 [Xanthobacter dioxanivorans]|uniref:Uncharacterized protein n=1 Tax=Xanthobacter dioxanivorans TaxID=2528964 RepID=A0A974PKV2_9HYPH|nr:hypothetical protein [Xanthobacter dioxanivorans]QRG04910.1 hypothetical protein EZH22_17375 [Xanthobacter dioxanivorans]